MNIVIHSDGARLCKFCYSDNRDILSDYLPIKYLYSENGSFELSLSDYNIPVQATHVYVMAYDGEMRVIHEEVISLDQNKGTLLEKPVTRIALISDLHTIQKGKSKRLLYEAFEVIKEQKTDFVITAGDNTNSCLQGEFDILRDSISNHLGNIPFYSALGNHDYFSNHQDLYPCEEAREQFFERIKQQNNVVDDFGFGTYAVRINGIHIIFLDCIQNSKNFRFHDDLAEWLRDQLNNSQNAGFRIIVNHLPLANHNLGCRNKNNEFMAGNNKLQKIISDCGNIVYISGHTHNRLDSDYPSAEQDENGNVYINAGSIGNTQPCFNDIKNLKTMRNAFSKDSLMYHEVIRYFKMASMGLFLDLYQNRIVLNGYDFSLKKRIPRCSFAFELRK